MFRGLFVTGTDTSVGKTVLSAALLYRFRHIPQLRYWKPVQTGIEIDDDTAEVLRLSGAPPDRVWNEGVRLPRPLSPHLAASLSGVSLSVADVIGCALPADMTPLIVEGAGGVLVPLNERELMIDVMAALELPVLIAARSGLGTINHTLLTIEALRSRRVPIAGVVMIGLPNADNRAAIETIGGAPVVGELPLFGPLTPDALQATAEYFAPGTTLERYFIS